MSVETQSRPDLESNLEAGQPCPRCDKTLPVNSLGQVSGAAGVAVSRVSEFGKPIYVCSECGLAEGLWTMQHPDLPLPGLDKRLIVMGSLDGDS